MAPIVRTKLTLTSITGRSITCMEWPDDTPHERKWLDEITNFEAKEGIAREMAGRLRDGDVVGVGSGSTSYLTLVALAERAIVRQWRFTAIATSLEMELACHEHAVPTSNLLQLRPDWSFDGADEIDEDGDMIKGRGGAVLRERLVMASSPERYVVVDGSKRVSVLGTRFPIPVEVIPESLNLVRTQLREDFGASDIDLRRAVGKDGPTITEHGNLLLDVRFPVVRKELDSLLAKVPGVVGTGLFVGFEPTVVSDGA